MTRMDSTQRLARRKLTSNWRRSKGGPLCSWIEASNSELRPRKWIMRKLVFFAFIVCGGAVGGLSALNDDLGLKIVMISIGTVVGMVLGGAISGLGAKRVIAHDATLVDGYQEVSEERDKNYWRDRGHPPFMRPPDALPDRHMLGPDRQD
jgi:hypothetical protein